VVLVAVAAFFGWRHARRRDAPTHPEVDLTTLDPPDADQARHGAGQPRPELLELAHLSPSAGTEWGQERGSARDRAGRLGLWVGGRWRLPSSRFGRSRKRLVFEDGSW